MRAPSLETRTARLKLAIAKKPHWARIGHGIALGYRRNQGPGTWSVRVAKGRGRGRGHWTQVIAAADDFDEANAGTVLNFWQAQDKARALGLATRQGGDDSGKLGTVTEALDAYEAELKARGGDLGNVKRIRFHLPGSLAAKTLATLAARDFKSWRAALTKAELSPAAINRSNAVLKAALNLGAQQDERVVNARAWQRALANIPEATEARNVVLDDAMVRAVVESAYRVDAAFGMLVEVAAVSGARVSQLARLEVADLQAARSDPRLMMPTSRKGRGRKVERRPVPIPASLAIRLLADVQGRPANAPLLVKPSGDRWRKSDHLRLVRRVVADLDLDASVTLYALRHSSITRQLLAGTPIRLVAALHDTSVAMIERTYSRYITDHSDTLARRALLDLSESASINVIPLARP